MRKPLFLLLAGTALAAQTINTAKVVDLTYNYDEHTIYWPTAKSFEYLHEAWGVSRGGYWYAAGRFSASEHGGTHLDSPIHFGKGQATTDQIPLSRLIAPAVVVDVSERCNRNHDYEVTAADLNGWEKAHGPIASGSIVVLRTGWGRYWSDKKQYLGSGVAGDATHLHFPGLGRDGASWMVQRKIYGVAIDTASLDHGPSTDFMAHRVLNGAGIYGLENVANAERLPPSGATIIALPMKIKGGSGGPVRIVAILP